MKFLPLPTLVTGWVQQDVATLPDFSSHSRYSQVACTLLRGPIPKGCKFSFGWVILYYSINFLVTHLNSPTKTSVFPHSGLAYRFGSIIAYAHHLIDGNYGRSLVLPAAFIEELKGAGLYQWIRLLYILSERPVYVCCIFESVMSYLPASEPALPWERLCRGSRPSCYAHNHAQTLIYYEHMHNNRARTSGHRILTTCYWKYNNSKGVWPQGWN